MKKIKSFTVDHNLLNKGMYISRIDGDIITYDIRIKKPNGGDYITPKALHTLEHLLATYVRNSSLGENVIFMGPMGCRTGFYFLTRDKITNNEAISLIKDSLEFVNNFKGEIPGNKKQECGNYLEHDLAEAKVIAKDMINVLDNWDENKLNY